MRHVDEKLCDRFRGFKNCEWCRKYRYCVCSHIYSRGAGRVDIPINLLSLCAYCESSHHDGNAPTVSQMETIVALREKIIATDIFQEVCRIRRLPKAQQGVQKARQRAQIQKRTRKPSKVSEAILERRRQREKEFRRKLKLKRKESKPKNRGMS